MITVDVKEQQHTNNNKNVEWTAVIQLSILLTLIYTRTQQHVTLRDHNRSIALKRLVIDYLGDGGAKTRSKLGPNPRPLALQWLKTFNPLGDFLNHPWINTIFNCKRETNCLGQLTLTDHYIVCRKVWSGVKRVFILYYLNIVLRHTFRIQMNLLNSNFPVLMVADLYSYDACA